jgi:hypothetical protein
VAALLTEPLAEKIVGPGAAAVNLQNGGISFAVHDDGPGFAACPSALAFSI